MQTEFLRAAQLDERAGVALAQPAGHHRNTNGLRGFDAGVGSPRRREVVGEQRRHETLDTRTRSLLDAPVGEHGLDRLRRGLGGDRAGPSVADQIGVEGQQLLDQAVHVVAVGQGVMHVQRRVRLAVADGQPQVDQRLALVEMRCGPFVVRAVDFHDLDSRVQQVIGDQLVAAVLTTLEARGEHRVRLEQRVEGVRQRIDVDRTFHLRGETHEVVRLGEHLLAERQLADDRRWKHVAPFWVCRRPFA